MVLKNASPDLDYGPKKTIHPQYNRTALQLLFYKVFDKSHG